MNIAQAILLSQNNLFYLLLIYVCVHVSVSVYVHIDTCFLGVCACGGKRTLGTVFQKPSTLVFDTNCVCDLELVK